MKQISTSSNDREHQVVSSGRVNAVLPTLPPGYMNESTETRLKKYLAENIPSYYAEMVNKTRDSYIQVIYTLELDSYYKNRMGLIGDAGMFVQPFTGSGVFQGYNNVKDLLVALKEHDSVDDALSDWSRKQIQTGKRLLALGEQMEKTFIWEQLDFGKVDEETTMNWWKESVTFPDNFNYQKG